MTYAPLASPLSPWQSNTLPHLDALAGWLTHLSQSNPHPILVLTQNNRQAEQLQGSLQFFAPTLKILNFPDWETLAYDKTSPPLGHTTQRLLTLNETLSFTQGILLTSAIGILQRLAPKHWIAAHSFQFSKNTSLDLQALQKRLTESGYQRVSQVLAPGEFANRGSILDFFPLGSRHAIRLDTDSETIDSLRYFSPETQEVNTPCDHIQITPAREFPLSEQGVQQFQKQWKQHWSDITSPLYQRLTKNSYPPGIEYYLPLFFEQTHTLLDYLPTHSHCVVLKSAQQQLYYVWQQIQTRYEQMRHDTTWPLLPPQKWCQSPEDLMQQLQQFSGTEITLAPCELTTQLNHLSLEQPHLFKQMLATTLSGYKILFCAERPSEQENLLQQLKKINIAPTPYNCWPDFLKNNSRMGILLSPIMQSILLQEPKVALIPIAALNTPVEKSQIQTHLSSPKTQALSLRTSSELPVGAFTVHRDHGIGQYLGLELIKTSMQEAEFLALAYAEGAKLYVPITDIHLISRYNGLETPPLDHLNTERWQKTKRKALAQLRDVAAELLDIYAQRAATLGFAFPKPDEDYRTFEASFNFEETPDQKTAIAAVIHDLCCNQPMDRLICGDVGFGKTEIAMRAAFIAVQAGKQVAILTPTTLLAEQHYRKFQDRFANWPVQIDWISRFRTPAEGKVVLEKLRQGVIDIIIGTHTLLGKQIVFKELGLVIIDEEHHFGVHQKEHLKNLKANIDVLTLTATPIPRTLQMAFSGLRELSIIATPPIGRLAIKNVITQREPGIIREAILRELLRGGQVYFVHNRIQTLNKVAQEIAKWIPEARIAVAHGQLPEHELENRMSDFYQQRCNILVCTSIIETGLDIPTANTLIVDRAMHFGLAQLHQLRGRVGRARHQAYAYFLISNSEDLTRDAKKRLEALEGLGELGAGFNLASHDLDIRGAGELLGNQQSGVIHGIGISLYMELLEQTIKALKQGQEPLTHLLNPENITVELHLPALLPTDYLPDVSKRLHYYQSIAQALDTQTLDQIQIELIDRYGLLPKPAQYLFQITPLKWLAKTLGITKIEAGTKGGRLTFNPKTTQLHLPLLIQLIQSSPQKYQLKPASTSSIYQYLYFKSEDTTPEQRIESIHQMLTQLTH